LLSKKFPERKERTKIRSEKGGVSYINARKKKVMEGRTGLYPFEKELPERFSEAIRHKNTPGGKPVEKFENPCPR
jgi:hypothetical protein